MANKSAPKKNWNDVQVAIATVSMVTTLAAWNIFAGPDRAFADEQAELLPTPPTLSTIISPSTPLGDGKVYFGGTKPQTLVVVQQSRNNGGGGGGGGGGGVVVPPPTGGGGGGGGGTGGS